MRRSRLRVVGTLEVIVEWRPVLRRRTNGGHRALIHLRIDAKRARKARSLRRVAQHHCAGRESADLAVPTGVLDAPEGGLRALQGSDSRDLSFWEEQA
jgi:hypothetical protein